MVHSCVAYGCNNIHDSRKPISFHSFPFKRPEVLSLWIKAIRRENWFPSKSSRLCGEHFLPSDFQIRPGCYLKLLKPSAVPSVFCFTKRMSKSGTPHRKLLRQDLEEDMENYWEYRLSKVNIRMKRDVVPHIFTCQPDKKICYPRQSSEKRARKRIIREILQETAMSSSRSFPEKNPTASDPEPSASSKVDYLEMDYDEAEDADSKHEIFLTCACALESSSQLESEPTADLSSLNLMNTIKMEPKEEADGDEADTKVHCSNTLNCKMESAEAEEADITLNLLNSIKTEPNEEPDGMHPI